jgi:hypothetical protein
VTGVGWFSNQDISLKDYLCPIRTQTHNGSAFEYRLSFRVQAILLWAECLLP